MTSIGNFGVEALEEESSKKMSPRICSEKENEVHSLYFEMNWTLSKERENYGY